MWPSFTYQDIRCGAGKQEPPENKMADKQKLTKGKRAVPYSKKKAPAKKTTNKEPADEQYVNIDHYDYTEKDWKVVPRPGWEKGRRETSAPAFR